MTRAWVVVGSAGQYEDHEKWIVAVFTSKADAARWAEAAQAYAAAFQGRARRWNEKHEHDENWPDGKPLPSRRLDHGLTYDRAYDVLYGVTRAPLNPTPPRAPRPRKEPKR